MVVEMLIWALGIVGNAVTDIIGADSANVGCGRSDEPSAAAFSMLETGNSV